MKKKEFKKTGIPKTPELCIKEAYRYLENAKKILKNVPIEYNAYKDVKMTQKACAIGYLGLLFAIDGFFLSKGLIRSELPTSIEGYWDLLERYAQKNGKIITELNISYQNLHILGYYRGGIGVEMIKEGFKNAGSIINHFSRFISSRKNKR